MRKKNHSLIDILVRVGNIFFFIYFFYSCVIFSAFLSHLTAFLTCLFQCFTFGCLLNTSKAKQSSVSLACEAEMLKQLLLSVSLVCFPPNRVSLDTKRTLLLARKRDAPSGGGGEEGVEGRGK